MTEILLIFAVLVGLPLVAGLFFLAVSTWMRWRRRK